MDWNSDGQWDIISGDREGYLNVFIRQDTTLTGYKQYKLMNSTVLDVGNNSEPHVFDWNSDGLKDLVIGAETGRIQVYLNQTTDTWPMFRTYFYVNGGGSPISFNRINPYIFDLDQDGRLDLLCGENNGFVHFFRNRGPDSAPVFARGETLRLASGQPVRWRRTTAYYGSRCGFGDWNNDGIPDFLMGSNEGQVELYIGLPATGVTEDGPSFTIHRSSLSVAPNPLATGLATVQFSLAKAGPVSVTAFDVSGRCVLARQFDVRTSTFAVPLDMRSLSSGVYLVRLEADGCTATQKLVVQGKNSRH